MADPKRTGGCQPFFNDAVAGTVVQISAGTNARLHSLKLLNTVAAVTYLQIFFLPATSVTLGTTVPDFVIRLVASEAQPPLDFPGGLGKWGSTGLSIAGTTTATGSTGAAVSVSATYA